MARMLNQWRVYVVPLALLVLGVCGCGDQGTSVTSTVQSDQDISVTSTVQSEQTFGIQQGVVGRVTASDGRPVSGAIIQPRSLDDVSPPIPDIAIITDDDGWYTWSLFPGTYELSIVAEGYQGPTDPVTVTVTAGQVLIADITLEPAP
jgi:hypothetical protein